LLRKKKEEEKNPRLTSSPFSSITVARKGREEGETRSGARGPSNHEGEGESKGRVIILTSILPKRKNIEKKKRRKYEGNHCLYVSDSIERKGEVLGLLPL